MLQIHATHKTQRVNNIALLLRYDNKYKRAFFIYKATHAAPLYGHPPTELAHVQIEIKRSLLLR
jgi:hypothetical protein